MARTFPSPPPADSARRAPGPGVGARRFGPAARQWAAGVLPMGGTLPDGVWARRHRGILTLLWLHVPGLFVFALAAGTTVAHAAAEAGVVAGLGIAALAFGNRRRGATLLTALGLLTASVVLVHLSGGTIEAHFHFFVMVGIVVLYQDWWPFLVAIGFVVVHHGTVGVLAPEDVFNHGRSPIPGCGPRSTAGPSSP